MTTDILLREDTGSFAAVRVIDPGVHVSAPYSRAVGVLDKWVRDSRHAVDEFAAWIEGQAAQAAAEMRQLCDELELPHVWAELPPTMLQPASIDFNDDPRELQPVSLKPIEPAGDALLDWWVNVDDDPGAMPGRVVRVGRTTLTPRDNPLAQAYAEREARGWTPDPAEYPADLLVVDRRITDAEAEQIKQRWQQMRGKSAEVEQGPRGGFWRRVDAVLERWDDWLRRKQDERDKRMGA